MLINKLNKVELSYKLSIHNPILIAGKTGTGKTKSIQNMPNEAKQRTVIINADGKGYAPKHNFGGIISMNKTIKTLDKEQIIPATEKGWETFKKLILQIYQSDKFDRIIFDTLTSMDNFLQLVAQDMLDNPYDTLRVWKFIQILQIELFNLIKKSTEHNKLCYALAHILKIKEENNGKAYVALSGNQFKYRVEGQFQTAVYTLKNTDLNLYTFYANSHNQKDSTRVNIQGGIINFPRYSLIDLEDVLLYKDLESLKQSLEQSKKLADEDMNGTKNKDITSLFLPLDNNNDMLEFDNVKKVKLK
jgi:hypothetical protein